MSERTERTGIFPGLTYDEYADLPGLRKSTLWPLVSRTPAHYMNLLENPEEETPAMKFGTAFHTLLLEPERFDEEYAVGGPINPKTGETFGPKTKKMQEWLDEQGGGLFISQEDSDNLNGMREAVHAKEEAAALLDGAERELSIVWEDVRTGRLLQARVDAFLRRPCIFSDLKSSLDASPRAFHRSSLDYGYFMQSSMYHDGVKILTGSEPYKPQFIVVEKKPPYAVAVHEVEIEDLEFGRKQYQYALDVLAICEKKGKWPAYPGVLKLSPAKWAKPITIFD